MQHQRPGCDQAVLVATRPPLFCPPIKRYQLTPVPSSDGSWYRGSVNRVLVDGRANRRLQTQGFVVVPLIGASAAAELRDAYLDLRSDDPGAGFDADLNNPDAAYRRRVAALLSDRLGDAVRPLFRSHEPFLWNFLCKWPADPQDLYVHRDWMFVDERNGSSTFSVWLALEDMHRTNGMLRVIPRSHRLARSLAGSGLGDNWTGHSEVMDRYLTDLPVAAGSAVVMHHALVHGSYQNRSERPRVAVNCAVRPVGEPLVHFRRLDDSNAALHGVRAEFFVEETPEGLLAAAPAAPAIEQLPAPQTEVSVEDIDRQILELDRVRRWRRQGRSAVR